MPPRWSGRPRKPHRSTAISARSCRSSIAGHTTTACRGPGPTSSPRTFLLRRSRRKPGSSRRRRRQEASAMTIGLVLLSLLMGVIVLWPFRLGQDAPAPVGERTADDGLPGRPAPRLEATARRRLLRVGECRDRLLLPADRGTRPACARRIGGLGPRIGSRAARRGSGKGQARRRTVRDLLALPARRLGGAVRAA